MQIESKKKKLCLEPLRGIITQGEKMADTVTFRLPATYGALILSDLSWQIRAASEKNTLVTADLTASSGGEFCLVQWEVSSDFTAVSGALSLMLVGTDSAGNVVIKFPGDDPIWVRDAETGQYSPPEDAIQKALNGLRQAESALEDATKALQEIGINFKILGHYGTLPELEAAVTNPSPGAAYGVGDPTVIYAWNGTSWDPLPGVFQPYPHTNLLVNPRFKYNSRDQQSYTGTLWGLDGWYCANITQTGNILTSSSADSAIQQPIKGSDMLLGKTATISIAVQGQDIAQTSCSIPSPAPSSTTTFGSTTTTWGSIALWYDSNSSQIKFSINVSNGQSITINGVKLELGSTSTLQADLDNPPSEDIEKLKLDMYDLDPGRCAYLPWHNENLLDNWYFVGGGSQQGGGQFPINQRGQTSYSGTGYIMDRWRFGSSGTLTISSDYIEFSSNDAEVCNLEQPSNDLPPGIYTLSFIVANGGGGKVLCGHDGGYSSVNIDGDQKQLVSITFNKVDSEPVVTYLQTDNKTVKCYAAKLELGYLSTLARKDADGNWVLNDPPPNFQQELAKCQRYYTALNGFGWIGSGLIDAGGVSGQFFIPLPVTMRKVVPTISGNFRVYNSSNNIQVTNVVAAGSSSNGINGAFNISGWNGSSGSSLHVWLNTNEILGISADL